MKYMRETVFNGSRGCESRPAYYNSSIVICGVWSLPPDNLPSRTKQLAVPVLYLICMCSTYACPCSVLDLHALCISMLGLLQRIKDAHLELHYLANAIDHRSVEKPVDGAGREALHFQASWRRVIGLCRGDCHVMPRVRHHGLLSPSVYYFRCS